MLPLFMELTYMNEEKFTINIDSIELIRTKPNPSGVDSTEIYLKSNTKIVNVKESPEEIYRKIVKAREYVVMEILERLYGEGFIRRQ